MEHTRRRRISYTLVLVLAAVLAFLLVRAYGKGVRIRVYRVAPGSTSADREPIPLDFSPRGDRQHLLQDFPTDTEVRNVIFLVGDGMSFPHMAATRYRYEGTQGRLFVERFPVAGWVTTHSLRQLYTDSAAGASALATGFKTEPLVLSQTPEGVPHRTILEVAMKRGMRGGMITTSTILDATPAAFASHAAHRRDYEAVSAQMAALGVEFLASEELATEKPELRKRLADCLAHFDAAGYRTVTSWEDLQSAALDSEKILAWFKEGTLTDRDTAPNLADLTELALHRLSSDGRGFFLLVEDEEIDTGSHKNDLPRVLRGLRSLDEAARRAVEFARRDRHTLVLLTADHETGGLMLDTDRHAAEGAPAVLSYRWISRGHTPADVPLLAYGPGAERLSGVLDNTDIPRILSELLGLEMF